MNNPKPALLILEDGTRFEGLSFGYEGSTSGEVVFNTAMTGYPESLTDPSYEGQILVTTYPILGNYGVPPRREKDDVSEYYESSRIHCRGPGLFVATLPLAGRPLAVRVALRGKDSRDLWHRHPCAHEASARQGIDARQDNSRGRGRSGVLRSQQGKSGG